MHHNKGNMRLTSDSADAVTSPSLEAVTLCNTFILTNTATHFAAAVPLQR